MSKPPNELTLALDFAAGEVKAAGATTFLIAWETAGEMHVRTHPQSAALLRGVLLLLTDQVFPDEPDDDPDENGE